ncbi:hypothetical protein DBR46_14655 [Pseudomonas sp. KBW05]|nr:hypothetical protein DBR46_14655 [Pseudomonas sp. KBW05]
MTSLRKKEREYTVLCRNWRCRRTCGGGLVWERACSRTRWVSQYICKLTHRIREQARSHTSQLPPLIGFPFRFLRCRSGSHRG